MVFDTVGRGTCSEPPKLANLLRETPRTPAVPPSEREGTCATHRHGNLQIQISDFNINACSLSQPNGWQLPPGGSQNSNTATLQISRVIRAKREGAEEDVTNTILPSQKGQSALTINERLYCPFQVCYPYCKVLCGAFL